jgi:hypothetical protein
MRTVRPVLDLRWQNETQNGFALRSDAVFNDSGHTYDSDDENLPQTFLTGKTWLD